MQLTDQSRLVPALVALRDKYRARAIRTQERALKTEGNFRIVGFMKARDYYIGAAEALDRLIPNVVHSDTEEA